jgi:hypothetical protein
MQIRTFQTGFKKAEKIEVKKGEEQRRWRVNYDEGREGRKCHPPSPLESRVLNPPVSTRVAPLLSRTKESIF